MKRSAMTGAGSVGAALLASLCCIGPVVFVTVGIGAGLASRLEPLRPIFVALTVALVGAGFYAIYGRPSVPAGQTCESDGKCAAPRNTRRDKAILWTATVLAILLLTFPQWSLWFV